jgi:amino acid adenylation domain-containing protein/non-ribosomal peptide synthase protein (TIGR01720 family)
MNELAERIEALSPRQRELLALRLSESEVAATLASGISRRPVAEHAPLSFSQQRLWFLDQLEPGNSVYNIAVTIKLTGRLKVDVLRRSFDEVVRRHEILRTIFVTNNDSAVQSIVPSLTVPLRVNDLTHMPESERWPEALRLAGADAQQPFDLATGPLLRVGLIRVAEEEHLLLLAMHHIISDGWSMGIFMQELTTLYVAYAEGRESPLPELPIQYADYAVWQREQFAGGAMEEGMNYWRGQLEGVSVLELPTDQPRPRVQTFVGGRHSFMMSREVTDSLNKLGQRQGVTLFMTLLAAFDVLLSRYCGQEYIAVGTPVAGRTRTEMEGLIGLFVNTLVVRTRVQATESFLELLSRVRESCLGAQLHQELPFEQLVDALRPERRLSHTPLFQVMFVLQNTSIPSITLPDLTLKQLPVEGGTAKFDLTLEIDETRDGLAASLEYSSDLFEPDTIDRLAGSYLRLLEAIAADPSRRVASLPLLGEEERQRLVCDLNDTGHDWPWATLPEMFREQARSTPEAAAVEDQNGERLTYAELDHQSEQLARRLRQVKVGPESIVAVLMDRCSAMVVALLAALKSGAAYLPLDPANPPERLRFMLADSKALVILTKRYFLDVLPDHEALVICVDADHESLETEERVPELSPDNLAYVIYTSGSTGAPKGVMVTHRGLANYLRWSSEAYESKVGAGAVVHSPIGFDLTVTSLWIPLISGTRVLLVGEGMGVIEELAKSLEREEKFTLLKLTPAHLEPLAAELAKRSAAAGGLRRLVIGGEALHSEQLSWWSEHDAETQVVNEYGPTETVVGCCVYERAAGELVAGAVPIGRPIANTRIFILDHQLQPAPVGVSGELYIGGEGLARGYHGRPELTAEKFIPDTFSGEPGARLYRTGDRARFLRDGEIEFLGRLDFQVKVRGFRIELGEIETALRQHSSVSECVVVQGSMKEQQRLIGYVVIEPAKAASVSQLRQHLLERLPDYMLPAIFVFLDALPLTSNGKVDRQALPEPDVTRPLLDKGYAVPNTPAEEQLVNIWSEVLGVSRVGIHDNFFELGGDSILSIQIISRANRAGLRLTPKQMFEYQTIHELAAVTGTAEASEATQEIVSGQIPLTPIQQWFLERDLPEPHHYNQAVLLEAPPDVDVGALERAVARVLEHHDALRLRFVRGISGWLQENAPKETHRVFSVHDLSGIEEHRRTAALETTGAAIQASLILTVGPLVRVAFFDMGEELSSRLLIAVHHLVIDGVSWRILLEDLQSAYEQLKNGAEIAVLPPKTSSYKQWAEAVCDYADTNEVLSELDHWTRVVRSDGLKSLPIDHGAVVNRESTAQTLTLSLSGDETRALLQKVPEAYRSQPNDALLSALAVALTEWAGPGKFVVNLEGHGREEILPSLDVSRTVGWFTSIFPFVLESPAAGETPGETLKRVKEQLRRIPQHGFGYGLLKYLNENEQIRGAMRGARADLSFNYLGQFDQVFGQDSLFRAAREAAGRAVSALGNRAHVIEIDALVAGGCLQVNVTYSSELHRRQTIEKFAQSYVNALRRLIVHCQDPLAGGFTPSDFPLARLEQQEIDRLTRGDRNVENVYRLSPMQQGLLFHTLYEPEGGAYVIQLNYELVGLLDVAALKGAWERVIARHAALRTAIVWEGLDQPVQVVSRRVELPIVEHDWCGWSVERQQRQRTEFLEEDRRRGFELGQVPLMRLSLVLLGEHRYYLTWSYHHIVLDGWCMPILMEEVFSLYEALKRGEDLRLPASRPYSDYIGWLQRQEPSDSEIFWRDNLAGFTAPTSLPTEHVGEGTDRTGTNYDEYELTLAAAATEALREVARRNHVTLNTIIRGAWALLLSRYSGERDVLFGVTVSGRPVELPGVESIVGLFINTLPLRVQVLEEESIAQWLQQLQKQQAEMQQYEYSPLVEVQGWAEVPRGVPLFNSILVFENYPVGALASHLNKQDQGLKVQGVWVKEQTTYPLTIYVAPHDRLFIRISYDRALFEADAVRRLSEYLLVLLETISTHAEQALSQLPALTRDEQHRLLNDWNQTQAEYPKGACVHELFEMQVARSPEAEAVIFEEQRLSYRELNEQANRLAQRLRRYGVGPESLVGVLLNRSAEMVTALLGVLKTGGAYVPLDPGYPQERLRFMLEDARGQVLLTQDALREQWQWYQGTVLCIDSDPSADYDDAATFSTPVAGPDNLAYVIYTSGSSGKPKGVAVTHSAVVNLLWHMSCEPGLSARDTLLAVTTLSFDIAALEIYLPLIVGAKLVIVSRETAADGSLLSDTLQRCDVTAMQATPTTWRLLIESGWKGASELKVLCGGEALSRDLAEQLLQHGREIWNVYGPTETTIWSTAQPVHNNTRTISIGRPISNTRAFILDARGRPVPTGAAGELFIGGDGLARGYLNRPALTAEKFVPDPFSNEPGARLYRTGDSARWLSNGEIEYLGRLDQQVKMRGFRIELGEIETALNRHSSVGSSVVVLHSDQNGDKHLVAYLVPANGGAAPGLSELRLHLAGQLPDYMIPSAFVPLEQLPLTPNGKINRRALPAPDGVTFTADSEYVAPRSDVESLLVNLWASVLRVEHVGPDDDFFSLGGHSLTATRLISRVRETFKIQLTLGELFEHSTAGAMARIIERALKSGARLKELPPLTRTPRDGALPLSFAQQRLWFLDQLEAGTATAYNVPAALRLTGLLNIDALSRSLTEIVRRHEVLRTTFSMIDEQPVQVIAAPSSSSLLRVVELSELTKGEREGEVRRLAIEEAQSPFDLKAGPLLRAKLLRLSDREHVALFTMHHIVCDAWSLGILVREVASFYEAFSHDQSSPLPELAVQYADFAACQREWLSGEVLESQLAYWKTKLGGDLPSLELPADRPRPPIPTRRGRTQDFVVPETVSAGLKHLAREEGMTLYMTLLAAFKTLLHRYTNQIDIIVGTPVANRSREELEPLIGFFANSLVLRTDLSGDPTFRELLLRVREVALGAYAHEDLPFETLVAELQPARDMSRAPLFNVVFTLQNAPQETLELSGLRIVREGTGNHETKFDLVFNLLEVGGQIEGSVEYNTDLFDDGTISQLLDHFQVLLQGVVHDPGRRLSALPLMSAEELHQALIEFNDTRTDGARDTCLHQLFERQAALTPKATALTLKSLGLSYGELNARANQLARYLLASGVEHGALVSICLEHSFETFVALFGVLKTGATYVPLEPAHPQQKLRRTLASAQVTTLITQQHLKERLAGLLPEAASTQILCLDSEWELVSSYPSEDLPPQANSSEAAYVLYTSGSTGEPKGVVVTHASVVNYVTWAREMYMPERHPISCAFYSSLAFDLTVTSVFAPLIGGHRIIIYPRKRANDVPLLDLCDDNQVEVVKLTPSHLALIKTRDNSASRIRRLVVGGEPLTTDLARAITDSFGGQVEIDNEYGPTEATVGCMIYRYLPERDLRVGVPIGGPAANTQIYLLDEQLHPVAGGVRGELYIGGAGVARGYLNRPAQTAERFVPDPFSAEPGARLYRTGDVAHRLADGTIEYLDRTDEQVKYHGHRVELGEISAALNEHPQVRDSVVVITKDSSGADVMVAYYVSRREIEWSELRAFLAERLVIETLPAVYVHLARLPLTLNGKIDKAALHVPETASPRTEGIFVRPRTQTEEMLAEIWAKMLHLERVDVNENFFELGGHSLLGTQLVSRVHETFNVDLPLRSLFERPTVAALAEAIEDHLREGAGLAFVPIGPAPRAEDDELPLSFSQQRLWFLDQLDPGAAVYNVPVAVRLLGPLNLDALELSFAEMIRRHESLRTTFVARDEQPLQVIARPGPADIKFTDLSHVDATEREAEITRVTEDEAQRPFDLAIGPLLRLRLMRVSEAEHVLTVTMHHIVSDGWSMGVLITEVATLYEAYTQGRPSPLPELPLQYADYAAWQREYLKGNVLEQQLSYWRGQLAGAPVLKLPVDTSSSLAQNSLGASVGITLDGKLMKQLKELSRQEGVTLFMTLLAAYQVLLARYTDQTDISVGTPVAGRTRVETEGLIGFFLNTLVMRTRWDGDPTFRQLLALVREVALGAYTHQDVPFEKLVEELRPERDLSHSPFFRAMFNHSDFKGREITLPELVVQPLTDLSGQSAKFDLSLYTAEEGGELNLTLVYKADLFADSTIVRICTQLRTLLEHLAADPGRPISSYSIQSESENFVLVSDFNE